MNKEPLQVLESIFAFFPNRETLGGTAYLIVRNDGNILIDCPAWTEQTQQFLVEKGGVDWLVITHRQGISPQIHLIQKAFGCPIIIQEQEAYLLPNLGVSPFQQTGDWLPDCQLLWTPGFSPGSACLYYQALGGILFSGRHLLPNPQGQPMPLRTPKTFHWPRQIDSLQRLLDQFTPQSLHYLCPGANTGYLRRRGKIDAAYGALSQLDLDQLRQTQV